MMAVAEKRNIGERNAYGTSLEKIQTLLNQNIIRAVKK